MYGKTYTLEFRTPKETSTKRTRKLNKSETKPISTRFVMQLMTTNRAAEREFGPRCSNVFGPQGPDSRIRSSFRITDTQTKHALSYAWSNHLCGLIEYYKKQALFNWAGPRLFVPASHPSGRPWRLNCQRCPPIHEAVRLSGNVPASHPSGRPWRLNCQRCPPIHEAVCLETCRLLTLSTSLHTQTSTICIRYQVLLPAGILQDREREHTLILSLCCSLSIFRRLLYSVTLLLFIFFVQFFPPPNFASLGDSLVCQGLTRQFVCVEIQ
jgi:hypothetical protein